MISAGRLSPFVGVTFIVVLVAIYFRSSLKSPLHQRLFSAEELALYNGTDQTLPILLGILGSVFDVTKGKSHYGSGGGYNHFAGRDASRAFVSGNFTGDGLTDSLRGLSSSEVKSIVDWRGFYFRTYTPVGKLVGRYYDSQGNPTKHLKGVEAKASRGAQLMEKQKTEEAKQPNCNSRWSQDEGGEVWCDVGVPRLVQRPLEIAITGSMSKRCACFEEDQLDQPGLEVYKDCEPLAKTCKAVEPHLICREDEAKQLWIANTQRISLTKKEGPIHLSLRSPTHIRRDNIIAYVKERVTCTKKNQMATSSDPIC